MDGGCLCSHGHMDYHPDGNTLRLDSRTLWRLQAIILFGYLAWGVMTILYPSAAFFKPVGVAIFLAILLDCLMTFFGSTANDAALNAYVTDVTTPENRGRVMGVVPPIIAK